MNFCLYLELISYNFSILNIGYLESNEMLSQ